MARLSKLIGSCRSQKGKQRSRRQGVSWLVAQRRAMGCGGFGHKRVQIEVEGGSPRAMMALWRGGNDG